MRMVQDNPMASAATRFQVSQTLRRIGHKPPVQGGNGRGLSDPQRCLLSALGVGWVAEYVVPTGVPRRNEQHLPTHYKVDVAYPERRWAIEVDGSSHSALAAQARDQKKDRFLVGCGWRVLRVSNQRIVQELVSVLKEIQVWFESTI
jgi:hypothetical protein